MENIAMNLNKIPVNSMQAERSKDAAVSMAHHGQQFIESGRTILYVKNACTLFLGWNAIPIPAGNKLEARVDA